MKFLKQFGEKLKLRFITRHSRQKHLLEKILAQISSQLALEKSIVDICLNASLYKIKRNHLRNFAHLDPEDRRYFIEMLSDRFGSSLYRHCTSAGDAKNIDAINTLVHDAASLALTFPSLSG